MSDKWVNAAPHAPRVAVVLVNWNGRADTLGCLQSLQADAHPNKWVIVVDNGSDDGSVDAIRHAFPNVTVLAAGGNLGFTGGNNLGIRRALDGGADYVYLLNNDTTSEPDALSRLVESAERSAGFGILVPVINYYDRPGEPWFAGATLDLRRGEAVHDNSRMPAADGPLFDLPWATGCAMLIPAAVVRAVGGFDERYFLICEDIDLSLRVRAAGYRLALVPGAKVYHKVHKSFVSSASYYIVRNSLLLVRTHAGGAYPRAAAHIMLRYLRRNARTLASGGRNGWADLAGTTLAVLHHLIGRYGPRRNGGRPRSGGLDRGRRAANPVEASGPPWRGAASGEVVMPSLHRPFLEKAP